IAKLHALEQLIGDVGVARRGGQSGEPIEAGEDAVLDAAQLDVTRPANDGGNTEAAFTNGAFGGFEWCPAAIPPGENFGAVVGGENDDGIVSFTHVVQVLQ